MNFFTLLLSRLLLLSVDDVSSFPVINLLMLRRKAWRVYILAFCLRP